MAAPCWQRPAGLLLLLLATLTLLQEASGFLLRPTASRAAAVAARAASGNGGEAGGAEDEVAIVVEGARSHTLLPGALATHGRLFNKNNAPLKFVAPNEDVGINVVAASMKGGGEPVVAFVSPQALAKASKGATLRVPRSAVVGRPVGVGVEDACLLPYYALSLLPQLMKAGLHDKTEGERKLCVVTGAGPDAVFAIQILRAWECRVVACSRREADALRKVGAEAVVDFSKESFTERFPTYAAVVDTVGVDQESIAANLERMKGAAYVSTMPSAIRRMQQKGLLQGAGIFASVFGGKPEVAPTNAHWLPERQGLEVVEYVLKLGPSLALPKAAPGMDDYWDAILWPKDAELNYRFGFPCPPLEDEGDWRSGRGVGRGSGLIDDAALLREYTGRRGGAEQENDSE